VLAPLTGLREKSGSLRKKVSSLTSPVAALFRLMRSNVTDVTTALQGMLKPKSQAPTLELLSPGSKGVNGTMLTTLPSGAFLTPSGLVHAEAPDTPDREELPANASVHICALIVTVEAKNNIPDIAEINLITIKLNY
jgi:hypothetical protein